jgi:hypothetical protein
MLALTAMTILSVDAYAGAAGRVQPVRMRAVRMTDTLETVAAAPAQPKAAAKPAPAPVSRAPPAVPAKPTTPYGNGARPRSEWDKAANYGRYAVMSQAYWSAMLPKKVQIPVADVEVDIPAFPRPQLLDGTHAGDQGFDPLGLARDTRTLHTYLEAEVKHGRLAMLAVLGWVCAELAAEAGLAPSGRAPSLLNGNLFHVQNLLGAGLIFALVSVTEETRDSTTSAALVDENPGMYDWQHFLDGPYVAGCYNFDPLGLYGACGSDASGRRAMRELEVQHGRLAMIAITLWAFFEPLTKVGPVTRSGSAALPPAPSRAMGAAPPIPS